MPPPRPLDDAERELLEAWVAAGAEWPLADEAPAAPASVVAARDVPAVAHGIDGPGEPLSFNRDVRPILSDNCYACHGPDEAVRQAGLRLDRQDSAHGVLPSGRRALVPGSLERSRLFQRIAAADPLDRMPPAHGGPPLSEREIEILGRFILQGAEFEEHWAFRPPERPDRAGHVPNRRLGARRARPVRSRAARPRGARTLARGGPPDAGPSPVARSDRVAAGAGRGRGLRRRCLAGRLGAPRRPAAGFGPLRRAHGAHLARRRALRRHERLPHRQRALHVALARLGDRRVQPQPAVRRVHRRTARRRPAAGSDAGAVAGHRLPPQPHDQLRGRRRARGVPGPVRLRPDGHDGDRVDGADGRLRQVPRPQVRSAQPAGVLPALGVLQHGGRGRPRRQPGQRRAQPSRPRRRASARCWKSSVRSLPLSTRCWTAPARKRRPPRPRGRRSGTASWRRSGVRSRRCAWSRRPAPNSPCWRTARSKRRARIRRGTSTR